MILIGLLFAFSALFNLMQFSALVFGTNLVMNAIGSAYEIVFFVIASLIYNSATNNRFRRAILLLATVFVVGGIVNLIFSPTGLASVTKLASNLIVIVYCIVYFFQLMRDLPTIHVHRLRMFWINSAFLLYSAGTVFLFAFIQYVIDVHTEKVGILWVTNLSLFIIHQLIIMVAVVYDLRRLDAVNVNLKDEF